jgi:hypothetical protein
MQHMLHMVCNQHVTKKSDGRSPPLWRDLALLNKNEDLLHKVRACTTHKIHGLIL